LSLLLNEDYCNGTKSKDLLGHLTVTLSRPRRIPGWDNSRITAMEWFSMLVLSFSQNTRSGN